MQKTSWVFPGADVAAKVDDFNGLADVAEVRQTLDEASKVLGWDVAELVAEDPSGDQLSQLRYAGPVMLAVGVASYRALLQAGAKRPAVVAGYGLGEYTALVCAEALEFADALKLVESLGMWMTEAVPAGHSGRAAIAGLDDAEVVAICREAAEDEVLAVSAFNAPGLVVIAGNIAARDRAIELCKEKGARRALPLAGTIAAHCALMQPAAEKLASALAETGLSTPEIPLVANVTAEITTTADQLRAVLGRQVTQPIRWRACVQAIATLGVQRVLEVGGKGALAGMARRSADFELVAAVYDAATTHDAVVQ
ncbi:ACP S-malonyltransferase [Streptomyces xanthophaeus]